MVFEITHSTRYKYGHPALEAYCEARLTPPERDTQKTLSHRIEILPETRTSSYTDHFGNVAHFFSLPYRHKELLITNRLLVETQPPARPEGLNLSVQETRQIFSSVLTDVFDYLQPTPGVPTGQEAVQWARKFIHGAQPLGTTLQALNEAVHDTFAYKKGVTDSSTPLHTVWQEKKGVCQDFVHVALSVLRTAGLPARYVCGYIEATLPGSKEAKHVGAIATHAWIEVLAPGMIWVALDPTNRKWCDDRYVAVSFGRDSRDAAPLRGTFKGSGGQRIQVRVRVKRQQPRRP